VDTISQDDRSPTSLLRAFWELMFSRQWHKLLLHSGIWYRLVQQLLIYRVDVHWSASQFGVSSLVILHCS